MSITNTNAPTHEGRVLGVDGDRLTTTCIQGKEHNFTLAEDTQLTFNGMASCAAELKIGARVRVTEKSDDRGVAMQVESGSHLTAPVAVA